MKYLSAGVLLGSVMALSGCAVSLQPFYTRDSMVDDRSIEGRWTDGETTWQVTRTAPARFEIATCEAPDPCKAETVGVLFRSAGVTFLDYQEKHDSMFSAAIHPHGLFQVQFSGGDVDLTLLDADRVKKLVEQGQLDTEYADLESGAILTASPANLQRFVVRHLSDGQIFGESTHLRRALVGE